MKIAAFLPTVVLVAFSFQLSGIIHDDDLRTHDNSAFTVGENLNYDIYYGPIVAGSATIAVPSYEYSWRPEMLQS